MVDYYKTNPPMNTIHTLLLTRQLSIVCISASGLGHDTVLYEDKVSSKHLKHSVDRLRLRTHCDRAGKTFVQLFIYLYGQCHDPLRKLKDASSRNE